MLQLLKLFDLYFGSRQLLKKDRENIICFLELYRYWSQHIQYNIFFSPNTDNKYLPISSRRWINITTPLTIKIYQSGLHASTFFISQHLAVFFNKNECSHMQFTQNITYSRLSNQIPAQPIYNQMKNIFPDQVQVPLIQNVVSFAKIYIESDLDLKKIAEKVQGSRYNKKRFPAVIMRKTKPKSTVLIFKSGRMIIIGSESETDAEQAAKKTMKDIQKTLNIKLRLAEFRVTNIVANADLGYKIDIGKLCQQKNVIRNDNFPGVVYKQMERVKSALIFSSGKVVFTGAKEKDSIDNAFTELKKKMQQFKKNK